jgi:DNA-binding transcriptional MerR regulator
MNEATMEWLTAAECALRTGLTVRALRVYENYGLITPGRSAAGWRHYGTEELLKLNEIGLLKVLGLTLTQIRSLLGRSTPLDLSQLLELQAGTLKRRRGDAEHGLATVEAALLCMRAGVVLGACRSGGGAARADRRSRVCHPKVRSRIALRADRRRGREADGDLAARQHV